MEKKVKVTPAMIEYKKYMDDWFEWEDRAYYLIKTILKEKGEVKFMIANTSCNVSDVNCDVSDTGIAQVLMESVNLVDDRIVISGKCLGKKTYLTNVPYIDSLQGLLEDITMAVGFDEWYYEELCSEEEGNNGVDNIHDNPESIK